MKIILFIFSFCKTIFLYYFIFIALFKAILNETVPSNWRVRLMKLSDNTVINCAQAILSLTFFEHSGYVRHDNRSISELNDVKFSENFCLQFVNCV